MPKTIYKQVLEATDRQKITIPKGAKFLCAREQMEAPCVWFECDPQAMLETRVIRIFGTGHDMHPDTGDYIGTIFLSGGQLVLHVYEGF